MKGIYSITSPSGKVYIGESKNIKQRWWYYKRLRCKGQKFLYSSLLKYGYENHEFKIIHIMEDTASHDDLIKMETYYMKEYIANNIKLLNLSSSGGGGPEWTDEAKKKRSEMYSGDKNPFYGKHHTEETRKIFLELLKGPARKKRGTKNSKPMPQSMREKTRNRMTGKKFTQEHRDKISKALKGRILSDETREKLRQASLTFYKNKKESKS